MNDYDRIATIYAEEHGIVLYRVNRNIMIYNVSYSAYLGNPRFTVQHRVNLDTGKEEIVTLKRFDKKAVVNR